jgi:DNA polymerase-3 subunit delta
VIYLFVGENSFEVEREIARQIADFDGEIEKHDGESLVIADLQDLLQGQTLFSDKRLIIIKHLSENKAVWEILASRIESMSSDIDLLLIEPKPDKRTKAYKDIVKHATLKDFPAWTHRDTNQAVRWVADEAKNRGVGLTDKHARHLVQRVGFDQWRLHHAIEKLSLAGDVSIEVIDELIEANPDENIFALLDTALRGDAKGIQDSIANLKLSNDAYQTFGLLSSQILQLSALALTDKPSDEVAKDIGAHPFVLSKLAQYAARLSKTEVKEFIAEAAETDMLMKSSGLDPWLHVEQLLIKIARI